MHADDDQTRVLSPSSDNDKTQMATSQDATQIAPSGREAATVISTTGGEKTRIKLNPSQSDGGPERILGVGDIVKQRFVLDRLLGIGGMGAVFRALDLRKKEAKDDRPYIAIKVLGEEFKDHPQALITLQREAKKTQDLAHPNIVTVYDFDRDGDLVYLTMEELTGYSLKDVLSGVKGTPELDVKKRLSLIRQIAEGLAYAHSKGIVHSDLKPANIFLTKGGVIKILDFGIARAANEELYQDSFDAGDLGAVTFSYASPEMLCFDPPHPSDDIYALGVIACELLGGQHPFAGKDAQTAQEQKLTPRLPKLKNPLMQKLLARSLHFERKQRIQDARAFLKQLNVAKSAPGRLAIAAVLLVVAFGVNYAYLQTVKVPEGPPFSALSVEDQSAFHHFLTESNRALGFGDLQGAVFNIDKAHQIHATNDDIRRAIAGVVELFRQNIRSAPDEQTRQFYRQQLIQLRQYPAFANVDIDP